VDGTPQFVDVGLQLTLESSATCASGVAALLRIESSIDGVRFGKR
jgi:hypothetical protein